MEVVHSMVMMGLDGFIFIHFFLDEAFGSVAGVDGILTIALRLNITLESRSVTCSAPIWRIW